MYTTDTVYSNTTEQFLTIVKRTSLGNNVELADALYIGIETTEVHTQYGIWHLAEYENKCNNKQSLRDLILLSECFRFGIENCNHRSSNYNAKFKVMFGCIVEREESRMSSLNNTKVTSNVSTSSFPPTTEDNYVPFHGT
jgi:hypothetical protein